MTQRGTPQLDGLTALRGIAAWFVVVYHYRVALLPYGGLPLVRATGEGFLAVDLFFVMSGFIIALNYRKDFRADAGHAYGRFMLLRLARIYPLHIVMLGILVLTTALLSLAHGQNEFRHLGYLAMSVVLIQSWGFTGDIGWNVPSWSISTEMFAYLAFPVLAWLVERLPGRIGALVGIALALTLLAIGAYPYGGLGNDIAHFGLIRCVLEFWAGMALQRFWEQGAGSARSGNVALALGFVLLLVFGLGAPDYAVIPAAFCCLVYAFAIPASVGARLLSRPTPILIGTLSYATYLVHYPMKDWVRLVFDHPGVPRWLLFPIYIAAVALASWPLYRFVEVPGRRALRRVADRLTLAPAGPISRV